VYAVYACTGNRFTGSLVRNAREYLNPHLRFLLLRDRTANLFLVAGITLLF
jgi:hypothetical protein